MNISGIIIRLKGKKAIILTDQGNFIKKKRKPGMAVGQQILIIESESQRLARRFRTRAMSFAAAACGVLIVMLCFLRFIPENMVFAYVDLDINPSIEFAIDRENFVLEVNPLNEDAKTLTEGLNTVNRTLDAAIFELVEKMEREGLIRSDKDNIILVSASLHSGNTDKKESRKLEMLLSEIKTGIENMGSQEIICEVLTVEPQIKKAASKNGLSMARQEAYDRAQKKGMALTVEEVRSKPVSDVLKEVSSNGDSYGPTGNSADRNDQKVVTDESTIAPSNEQKPVEPKPSLENAVDLPAKQAVPTKPSGNTGESGTNQTTDGNNNTVPAVSNHTEENVTNQAPDANNNTKPGVSNQTEESVTNQAPVTNNNTEPDASNQTEETNQMPDADDVKLPNVSNQAKESGTNQAPDANNNTNPDALNTIPEISDQTNQSKENKTTSPAEVTGKNGG